MNRNTRIIFSILSGILLAASFPPMPFFLVAFFSFLPLIYILDTTKKFYFWNTYITFFLYHTITLWWISSFQEKTDPFLMISGFALDLFHPFFFMVPVILFLIVRIKLPRRLALYSFPFIWTAFEWAHSLTELSFPWLSFGYTQVYNTNWVQIADIFGVFGTTFIILLVNVIIYDIITNIKSGNTGFTHSKYQYSGLFLLLVLPIIYSNIQLNKYNHNKLLENNEKINIGLVQPNIDPWDKWSAGPVDQVRTLMNYTEDLLKVNPSVELVLWPETSVLYINTDFNLNHNFGFLYDWTKAKNISLLTGFVDIVIYKDGDAPPITKDMIYEDKKTKYDNFNSALLLDSTNKEIYHKMKLTPFGERVPHVEVFSFLTDFINWGVGISFWGIGTDQKNLTIENQNVILAPIICIESIYPSFVSEFGDKGANLFTVITNDAWYDFTPGPEQHALISAFRAIENKKYVARAANSGVTCFISPAGEIMYRAEQYKQASIAMTVPLINGKTIYSDYGDWWAYLSLIASLFFILYSIFYKAKKSL